MTQNSQILDAHLHVWDLQANTYPWLTPELGPLYANYSIEQARTEARAAGITEAILVQAEDSVAETDYLLGVAEEHSWIRGVVGWLPLDDPAAAGALLERYDRNPLLVGLRHLIHEDPRPDLLDSPEARRTLAAVAEHCYPIDIPDAWPRHLQQVERLAAAVPDLRIVVDHLAKPPRAQADFPDWARTLRQVAAHENTVAKLSGLHMPGQPYTAAALRPAWEVALEAFGPDRLLYGSDWPMSVPHGGYGPTHEVLMELVSELSAPERTRILRETARRVYRLADS
ncbi:amidohydrolase family protein [Pseudactinotalea sp. Z1748]|uniref:amidohydrolase family protein n=1 Tax=Pseudactinotalea sp. Z1748 TaxID=3413027 RepID=UPI003C7D5DE7